MVAVVGMEGEGCQRQFSRKEIITTATLYCKGSDKDNDMGQALAKTLGDKPTALMRGHGAVVVADSVKVVAGRAYYMMINAKVQMQAMAMATGGRKVMYFTPEEAATSSKQDGYERAWMLWSAKQKGR